MKNLKTVIIVIICAGLCLGYFYYLTQRGGTGQGKLSEAELIITKDLEASYPETVREVIKFYNRIVKCYYSQGYTEEQLERMVAQARFLMDEELQAENPMETYLAAVKADIEEYKKKERTIYSISMDSSKDIIYKTIEGRECAYVDVTYSMKGKDKPGRSSQTYILREDDNGRWKILGFFQEQE